MYIVCLSPHPKQINSSQNYCNIYILYVYVQLFLNITKFLFEHKIYTNKKWQFVMWYKSYICIQWFCTSSICMSAVDHNQIIGVISVNGEKMNNNENNWNSGASIQYVHVPQVILIWAFPRISIISATKVHTPYEINNNNVAKHS